MQNMDGSQVYYAKGKKLDLKEYIPYDSICIAFWKRQNSRNRKLVSVASGSVAMDMREFGALMELFYILTVAMGI